MPVIIDELTVVAPPAGDSRRPGQAATPLPPGPRGPTAQDIAEIMRHFRERLLRVRAD